jgi:nucleotide-binding universal stress UspA family protein
MNTKNDNKVLACVDRSGYADAVAAYAAWAARQMSAPLELLQVIDRHPELGKGSDHSGAIGINAQEQLLTQLSAEDEAQVRSAKETGRIFLGRLRQLALNSGAMEVDVRLRHGSLAETLAEQEGGVRLIVMGRRGESADATKRDLGRQVEHTVRHLHKPILLTVDGYHPPERVMFAFDGSTATRRGVDTVAASPLFHGIPIHLLMSGKATQDAPKHMAWAAQKLADSGFEVTSDILPGDAEQVIARTIQERQVDLLIMGSYSHSALRSLFLGSKTNDLLRASRVPTLLLR